MIDIIGFLGCLSQCIDKTTLRRLHIIVPALLAMSGRITMLGISRWTGKGGSYRTVQRFFYSSICWITLNWFMIRTHLLKKSEDCDENVILIGGDETTVTKSGKKTHGVDRFFSSIVGKPVPAISFFSLSLISVNHRKSYPIMMEQVIKAEKPAEASKKKPMKKDQVGRPKGSKNKNKRNVELSPEQLWMQEKVKDLVEQIGSEIAARYFVYDGAFGNNSSMQMVKQCGLELISKLRCDAALYFPYEGPYSGRGPRKKYGDRLDYEKIPPKYLKDSSVEEGIQTDVYQMTVWNKKFADKLNVVVIIKTNLKTGKIARAILFSSDLDLAWDKIMLYYSLRFQIEFNFRDAKQHWGLEDFMNVKQIAVHNGANLSMFMVNVSQAMLVQSDETLSVNDLKSVYRGHKYLDEVLKLLPQKPERIFIQQLYDRISSIGKIHVFRKAA